MRDTPPKLVILPPAVSDAPLSPPSPGARALDLAGESMGTTWSVRLFAPPELSGAALRGAITAELARIIALFSPWVADSEVSRLNAAPEEELTVSPGFRALLAPLMEIAAQTGGASDPTLGALTDLWGFGPPGPRQAPPAAPEIDRARSVSGWQRVSLEGTRLRRPPGMRFDFSGSAKGLAVDLISRALTGIGAGHHLAENGGECFARGLKPDMRPWWVAIEQPPELPRVLVALNGHGLATSGDERCFRHDGRCYAHTIDPATGWPAENDLTQVSVIAADTMQADALASALMVMGAERGLAHARRHGIAALMLRRGGARILTPAMERMTGDDG